MMLGYHFKIIPLLVLVKFCGCTLPKLGDRCFVNEDKELAACTLYNDCPTARNLFRNLGQLPHACASHNAELVVCCLGAKPLFKALSKCKEYSSFINCSMKSIDDAPFTENCLVPKPFFPPMAYVLFKKSDDNKTHSLNRNGVLISSRYVLSTGTLNVIGYTPHAVRLGALNLIEIEETVDYLIEQVFVHPNYRLPFYNDIGLVKLSRTVVFSQYIHPICLPDTDIEASVVYRLNYENQNENVPLVKYQRRIVPNEICNLIYGIVNVENFIGINDGFICTTSLNLVDSNYDERFDGAPLIVDHPNVACSYVLLGVSSKIVNWRIADAAVKTYNYIDWIERIISDDS